MNNVSLEESVKILEKSRKVVFLTGAGMSADSGISTFSDKHGFWKDFPVYRKTGLHPEQLANDIFFRQHPELSWGFYEWRRRNAQENQPHEGYEVINQILKKKEGFVLTTNTDGYHLRSGTPPEKLVEIHGSMWRLQLLDGSKGYVVENEEVPLCEFDKETMVVSQDSIPRYEGKILRPNVLMFDDSHYVSDQTQKDRFQEFQETLVDTVFLIGSGKNVKRNLNLAKFYQQRGSKVVCINSKPNECYPILEPDVFLKMRAEEGLTILYRSLNGN